MKKIKFNIIYKIYFVGMILVNYICKKIPGLSILIELHTHDYNKKKYPLEDRKIIEEFYEKEIKAKRMK